MPRQPIGTVWTTRYFSATATSWTSMVSGWTASCVYPAVSFSIPTPENMKAPSFDIIPPMEDIFMGRRLGIYKDEENNPRIGDSEFIDEELEFSTA